MSRLHSTFAYADRYLGRVNPDGGMHARSTWIAIAILLAFATVIWLPALDTPFWGDDYVFLGMAHAANIAGQDWWSSFRTGSGSQFWRPLSQDAWWLFIDATLGDDSRRTHWASLTLLTLASSCVGLLARAIARVCDWPQPGATAVLGGVVYGLLALHFLPVHWAAAANSSILVVFCALILAAWVAAPRSAPLGRSLLLATIPPLLVAALLSKESAALIPLLMVVLALFVGLDRYGKAEALVWAICCGIAVAWLPLHASHTTGTDPQYDLVLGGNLIRNGLSLVAWLLNVPREALRLTVSGQAGQGLLWASAVAVPMAGAWLIAARQGLRKFTPRQVLLVMTFCLVAYAPYFPLAWNSYAYYAAIAAMLPALVLARGLAGQRSAVSAAILIGLSSWMAVAGSRWLDNPGLIGRARWAEATLQSLACQQTGPELWVRADDRQRFYAVGSAGLAWRLGLTAGSVHLVEACPSHARECLIIDGRGHYSWEHPGRDATWQGSAGGATIVSRAPDPGGPAR